MLPSSKVSSCAVPVRSKIVRMRFGRIGLPRRSRYAELTEAAEAATTGLAELVPEKNAV
jgi:hypothetical protein